MGIPVRESEPIGKTRHVRIRDGVSLYNAIMVLRFLGGWARDKLLGIFALCRPGRCV